MAMDHIGYGFCICRLTFLYLELLGGVPVKKITLYKKVVQCCPSTSVHQSHFLSQGEHDLREDAVKCRGFPSWTMT